jgi:hypothetical protein
MTEMDRRDFLKDLALGGALLRLGPGLLAQTKSQPDMAIVTGESPAAITRAAMTAMGGIGRFIAKGDKVMIKPNIGWDRTPELGAGTNPEVVKTLVELCFEAGAKDVTVMDNTSGATRAPGSPTPPRRPAPRFRSSTLTSSRRCPSAANG